MRKKLVLTIALLVVSLGQFLVVPVFSNMALGGKVLLFSVSTACLGFYFVYRQQWLLFPKLLIPLVCLAGTFLVSLLLSVVPAIGFVEFGTFIVALLFCLLLVNFSEDPLALQSGILDLLRIIGLIVASLCLYQYVYWLLEPQNTSMLIPYLLPPGSPRVTGVYGQSNLTALLLLLSIVGWLSNYALQEMRASPILSVLKGGAFFIVSSAFFLTGSRAGMIALFLIVFCLYLLARRELYYWLRRFWMPSVLLIGAYFIIQIPHFFSGVQAPGVHVETSVDARFFFWTVSFLEFLDNPFWGVGLDHFKIFLPKYAIQAHDALGFIEYEAMGYTNWTHNEYLQILAESGVIGFSFLCLFGVMFSRMLFGTFKNQGLSSSKTYLYIAVILFFCLGMFSWPFRHPGLLFIFFLILGGILTGDACYRFSFRWSTKTIFVLFLVVIFGATGALAYKEHLYLQVKKKVKSSGCVSGELDQAMLDPYLAFNLMRNVLPVCITEDKDFWEHPEAVKVYRPFFEKIAILQGTYEQWYNLGLIYHKLGNYDQSEHAFTTAVERQPVFEQGWKALHAIHIEEAARQTGNPIEDFLPPKNIISVDFYDSVFKRQ